MTNRVRRRIGYRRAGFPGSFMLATGIRPKSDQCLILPPAYTKGRILCAPSHSPQLPLSDERTPRWNGSSAIYAPNRRPSSCGSTVERRIGSQRWSQGAASRENILYAETWPTVSDSPKCAAFLIFPGILS